MKQEIKSMNIKKAAEETSRVLMFDHWMRHYYVVEREGKMYISIPEDVMESIKQNEPEYFALAELVNEDELTYENSQATVLSYISARFDGKRYEATIMAKMFDSKEFKLEMYVFNLWMKGHEEYLNSNQLEFADWIEMITEWKKMDQVKTYLEKLYKNPPGNLGVSPDKVQ